MTVESRSGVGALQRASVCSTRALMARVCCCLFSSSKLSSIPRAGKVGLVPGTASHLGLFLFGHWSSNCPLQTPVFNYENVEVLLSHKVLCRYFYLSVCLIIYYFLKVYVGDIGLKNLQIFLNTRV